MTQTANSATVTPGDGNREPSGPAIAHQLILAFAAISAISIGMCIAECFLVFRANRLVSQMQELEDAFRHASQIANAVREQYIHQAHWIIEKDDEHLSHIHEAETHATKSIDRLMNNSNTELQGRLLRLQSGSQELARVFSEEIVPAAKADDAASVLSRHRALDQLSQALCSEADEIAAASVQRMATMHDKAIRATQMGTAVAVLCIVSVFACSTFFVIRLNRSIARPVTTLAEAANALSHGNLRTQVDPPAEGELRDLALAFNHMSSELARRQELLVHRERLATIGQLAAGLAHEINNPIGIIRGYLKTMRTHSLPSQLHEELEILDEEAVHCERLATDLLYLSRATFLRKKTVNVERLICRTVERFRETSPDDHPEIEVRAEPGVLNADEGRLRQVMLNLLKNAVCASDTAKTIDVTGQPTRQGGYVIRFADRGHGVSAEDRERIFEPFFSRSSTGSGLGLPICLSIVRAHGGNISFRARDRGGTVVTVVLPSGGASNVRR